MLRLLFSLQWEILRQAATSIQQSNLQVLLLQLAFFCVLPSGGLAVPMEIDLASVRTPGDGSG